MAITQTGAIYKSLSFDNTSSRSYGVYITGEAVYNAPERAVEMISIPGRNGSFALDQGRFENIEVTYPAGIFADNETDFAQAISDFRNYLCSKKGYCRLTDEYNPNEYRMAVYKSGLEVDPAQLRAGEFEITFECKPQRFLTSGETKQTIANSGDTITNPTLFESRPMIEVEGYGKLTVNGRKVTITNETYGEIMINGREKNTLNGQGSTSIVIEFNPYLVNTSDTIVYSSEGINAGQHYDGSISGNVYYAANTGYDLGTPTKQTVNMSYGEAYRTSDKTKGSGRGYLSPVTFTVGTASSETGTLTITQPIEQNGTTVETATITVTLTLAYDGSNTVTSTMSIALTGDSLDAISMYGQYANELTQGKGYSNSTATILGHPTYIDCDLGICYKIENNKIIDLNRYIDLGSNMPELSPGSNTITFDNTYTQVDIVPRWWKV